MIPKQQLPLDDNRCTTCRFEHLDLDKDYPCSECYEESGWEPKVKPNEETKEDDQ
jgi:hypothetical protein